MRRLVLVATLAAAVGGLGAGTASAVCDPDFEPLCVSSCWTQLPDPHDPTAILTRVCPA